MESQEVSPPVKTIREIFDTLHIPLTKENLQMLSELLTLWETGGPTSNDSYSSTPKEG
jgi:hypothetical protein